MDSITTAHGYRYASIRFVFYSELGMYMLNRRMFQRSKDTLLRGKKCLIVHETKKNYYLCPVETFYDSTYTSLIQNKKTKRMLAYL
jgi:hypothetical protein